MSRTILVVGAGFAGAVHARELADRGWKVHVIDKRDHVAGNAFDSMSTSGVRVHRYGPHLFHTNNVQVVAWLRRFGDFVPYEHRVAARLGSGQLVPLPINRLTINTVFGTRLGSESEVRDFLACQARPIEHPANAAEYLLAHIGETLTDLFFRPYTRKMWDMDLEDLDAAVVKRIPLRYDDEDRYFPNDRFQMLPAHGYTCMFERVLDHAGIRVTTSLGFDRSMLDGYAHCFNSMPIDEYFDDAFGPLPYRSIRFHHREVASDTGHDGPATTNFTDRGRFTRETDWARLPAHRMSDSPTTTVTREEPCDYRENDQERYYPVKTGDGRYDAAYRCYKALAEKDSRVTFIGRCGTYQYLDMHQVINQSLACVRAWMAGQGGGVRQDGPISA